MNNRIYRKPESKLSQQADNNSLKPGIILKILLVIFTLLSCFANYLSMTIIVGYSPVGLAGAFSPILLGVIIVGIYQIGKRYRNTRSRYKIFLYCQILFFLSSASKLISIASQNAYT